MNTKTHPEIADYVKRLRASMADLPRGRREEIVAEIEEHIEEALGEMPSTTEADIRNLLERVGDPHAIAAEARERPIEEVEAPRTTRTWPAAILRFLRRHLRMIIVTLVVLLMAFAGFAAWYVTQFQPLVADGGGGTTFVRTQSAEHTYTQAIHPVTGDPFYAYAIPYRDGEWFEYGFTLGNDSPYSVTVEEIMVASDGPFRQAELFIDDGTGIPIEPRQVRTRPLDSAFSIPPQTARFIRVRSVFGGCSLISSDPGARVTIYQQRITFRFLGVSRTEFLPLPYSLAISGREGCGP